MKNNTPVLDNRNLQYSLPGNSPNPIITLTPNCLIALGNQDNTDTKFVRTDLDPIETTQKKEDRKMSMENLNQTQDVFKSPRRAKFDDMTPKQTKSKFDTTNKNMQNQQAGDSY